MCDWNRANFANREDEGGEEMAPLLESSSGLLFLPPSSLSSTSLGIASSSSSSAGSNNVNSTKLEGEIKQLVADICADRDRPFGGLLLKVNGGMNG